MTGKNNGLDGPDEGNVNQKKESTGNLYSQLISGFAREKMKDKGERFPFAKKISAETTLSPELLTEIQTFAGKNKEFDGLEITESKIQIPALKREIAVYLGSIQRKNVQLRDIILKEYSISPKEYEDTLEARVEKIDSENELSGLLKSDELRRNFLKKNLAGKLPPLRDVFDFLAGFDMPKKYAKLPEEKKESLYMTVQKMQRRQKIGADDVWELFESGVFSPSEKERLLATFVPTMNLQKAVDLGIFSSSEAKKHKKTLLKKTIDDSILSSESEFDFYVDQIDVADVFFSTKDIFTEKKNQDKFIDSNFFVNEFAGQYNSMLEAIEKKFEEKSIQTAPEMLAQLKQRNITGLSLFSVGSTLVFQQKLQNSSGKMEDTRVFAEISSLSDKGYLTLIERGTGSYDSTIKKVSRVTYSDFLRYVTEGKAGENPPELEIISSTELKKRIVNKDIHDVNTALQLTDKSDFSSSIKDLNQKIDARNKELQEQKIPKSERRNDSEMQELHRQKDALNAGLEEVDGLNHSALLKKMSEIDGSGERFGFEVGTTFEVSSGKKTDAFTITDVDKVNQRVSLRGVGEKTETMSYAEFVEQFERTQAKRVSNIKNFESLFSQGNKSYDSWGGYEFKDGKIRKKGLKGKYNFNFLVPPKGGDEELIKIHEVLPNGQVIVSFGEVKDIKKEKHDDHHGGHGHHSTEPEYDKQVFSVESNKYTLSLGVLDSYIRKGTLGPRTIDDQKVREEEAASIPRNKTQWSFMSAFFKNMSIAEVMKGGEMFIEHFGKMLEEGSEHKAGHFALHQLGRFLPEEARIEFQSRIEAHEKHEMDEHLERLKGIGSIQATQNIENWLRDPNCPEYKKEAGLMFMLSKYGALYAKEALYKYKGNYFWYQALGGSVNPPDTNFVEVTSANDRLNLNTSEEQLVYELIKKQTKPPHGYTNQRGTVHRRSKLDKELKAMRGQGKLDEIEVGEKDGKAERAVEKRVDGAKSEMLNGNYPNAIGWLKEVVNKGGPMHVMNEVPFVMMFSGMAYEFEQDLTDTIKSFTGQGRLLPMLRFISYQRDIDLVNDTILEICKNLERKGGKFAGILTQAQSIYNNQKNRSVTEKSKQQATFTFYEKYGEDLTNILYMLNTGSTDDTLSKMIFFEKDNQVDANGKEIAGTGNEVFKRYYEKNHGYFRDDGNFGVEELMSDAFKYAGTSGMDMYKAANDLFLMKMGSFAKGNSAQFMWTEIQREFEAIPKRKYDENPIINKRMQEKLLEENLRLLIAGIMTTNNDPRGLGYFNAPNSATNKLNTWGIYLNDFAVAGANEKSILAGEHSDILQKFVRNIMDSELTGKKFNRPFKLLPGGGYEFVDETSTKTQAGIGDIISGKTAKIMNNSRTPTVTPSPFDDEGGFE